MPNFIKENWFVTLIAIIMISFIGYFIYDGKRYDVSSKSDDGEKVLATVDGESITAEDFFNEEKDFDGNILYNLYKNAIVDQSIEITKDIKSEAKTMESTIRSNFSSQYGDDYETSLAAELGNYGFTGDDALYNYCVASLKEKEMNRQYVTDNYDSLKENVEAQSPRTISIIKMSVADSSNLTDDEKSKQESIDKEIKDGSFESAATAFSEDTTTAPNKGYYGYVDKNSTALDTSVIEAAINTKKGETSDWITVVDSSSQATYFYKVYVNETDLSTLFKSDDSDVADSVLYAFIQNNTNLSLDVIDFYASKLDIDIKDEDVKNKIDNYINAAKESE